MKKVITFIIFCTAIFNFSCSQNNYTQLDSIILFYNSNDSIGKYYKYVYKAEDYIMMENFEKAAETYEKAFTYIDIPFLQDLGNAKECEMNSRKNEECIKKYIYFLIRKNGTKDGYLKNEELQKLETWSDIKAMIDTLSCLNDTAVVNELERIIFNDQDYRNQCHKKYNGNTYNEFTRDSIAKIDSINYYKIYRMFENIDMSEEIFGYRGWGIIDVILMHNRQRKEIYELLIKSVFDGKLNARDVFSSLDDSNYKFENKYLFGGRSFGFNVNDDCYMYIKPNFNQNLKINKYRQKIYLENISDFHKKRIWQMRNKDSGFFFYVGDTFYLNEALLYNLITNGIFYDHKVNNLKLYYSSEEAKKTLENNAKKWAKEQSEL